MGKIKFFKVIQPHPLQTTLLMGVFPRGTQRCLAGFRNGTALFSWSLNSGFALVVKKVNYASSP